MNTKRPILDFFQEHFAEYSFSAERRPNLLFKKREQTAIYHCIALQRDNKSCGLAVEIAATYNPLWRGESAPPLGISSGLANLRLQQSSIEIMQHWRFYEPTAEGLMLTLKSIKREFDQLAPAFYSSADEQLLSNRILQLALNESAQMTLDECEGLEEALSAAKLLLRNLQHPAYIRLRDRLQAAWTSETPDRQRGWTNRLACECIYLKLQLAKLE